MFCIPFTGGMSYYSSSPATMSLLNAIKAGCDNDVYVDEEIIEKVIFVEERLDAPIVVRVKSDVGSEESSSPVSISSGLFIFLVTAGFIFLIMAVQMCHKKKKRKRIKDRDESEEEEHDSSESNDSFEREKLHDSESNKYNGAEEGRELNRHDIVGNTMIPVTV